MFDVAQAKAAPAKESTCASAPSRSSQACACGCTGAASQFSFGNVAVYGTQPQPTPQTLAQPAAGNAQNAPGAPTAQPSVSTSSYSIAAAQKVAASAWIPDPVKRGNQLFGITPLPRYTAPEFHTDAVPGKGVSVRATHADLQSVVMTFLGAGQYADPTPFQWQCDVMVDRSCYPDNSMIKPHIIWDVTQDASDLLAAGEQEHCNDYQFAFYAILGRGAEIINALASAGTIFPNEAAAKAELKKTTALDPKDWKSYFECLVKASIKTRDEAPNSWHTPLPPTHPAVRRRSRLVSGTARGQYDDFVVVLVPHAGKHSTWDVINDAATSCNAGAQPPSARAAGSAGRESAPIPPPPATVSPDAKPETAIRNWLEQHQFAPPEKQPDEGEQHVLLNGEDMKISDAVKIAASALGQPAEVVRNVIATALAKPVRVSGAGLPYVGANNQVPGINLTSPRDAFGVSPWVAQTVEISTIDDYLNAHGFATPDVRDPTGDKVLMDGKETTVERVADRALALLGEYPTLKRADVIAHIRQKYVAARGGAGNQIVIGYTLIPKAAQFVGGTPDPLNPLRTQHQFSFTITRQHHANDSPGLETSFQGSVTLTDQGILNVQAGGQEAIVLPLLSGWIQVSGLVQIMASENWSKTATGTTVISPAVQAVAGGQILLTPSPKSGDFMFLRGHAQLGVQVLGGAQASPSGVVGVANVGLVLNIPF